MPSGSTSDNANATSLTRTQVEWLADGAACLEAALTYLRVGWCVIPLCAADHVGVGREHGRRCKNPGKCPLISGWTSFTAPPTADQIRGWWRQWPNCNLGIVLGRVSGLIGIDVDGPAGELAWTTAVRAGVMPPPTASFTTSAGSRRLLFSVQPDEVVTIAKTKIADHQEVRLLGEGSQTVVPPSRHWRGDYYRWSLFTKVTTPPKTQCGTSGLG
jgi:hypothetical protein